MTGCNATTSPQRKPNHWTAERYLPPYRFNHERAVLRPVEDAADYILVREVDPKQAPALDPAVIQRVSLDAGELLGFTRLSSYRGLAVAGEISHEVRTTQGVQYVWYRPADSFEKASADAQDVVRGVGTIALIGALWLSLEILLDDLEDDDDDE